MEQRPPITATASMAGLRWEAHNAGHRKAPDPANIAPTVGQIVKSGDSEAVEIGEPRLVDEPAWWDSPTEAIELGDPLDADDPTNSPVQKSVSVPRGIGARLDADSPWLMPPEAPRRPIDIGPALDATHFERNPPAKRH